MRFLNETTINSIYVNTRSNKSRQKKAAFKPLLCLLLVNYSAIRPATLTNPSSFSTIANTTVYVPA
ncbi:MAG TPA: hypothetical protein PLS36_09070, partial [Clostridia bacterium]|nr:hypothetical protein [Clostridia bacterium]